MATITIEATGTVRPIPVEQLRTMKEWAALTEKQATWVATYIEGGYNGLHATKTAFSVKSDRNARLLTYEVLDNPRVKGVLALHFRQSEVEVFLADLQKTIQRSKGIARVRAQALYARIKWGIEDRTPIDALDGPSKPESEDVPYVGQIRTQYGMDFRVTAVGTRVTAVEKVEQSTQEVTA